MVSDCQPADSSSTAASNGDAADESGNHSSTTHLLQLQFIRSVLSVNPCVVSSASYDFQHLPMMAWQYKPTRKLYFFRSMCRD